MLIMLCFPLSEGAGETGMGSEHGELVLPNQLIPRGEPITIIDLTISVLMGLTRE